jgi:hypothetical protein
VTRRLAALAACGVAALAAATSGGATSAAFTDGVGDAPPAVADIERIVVSNDADGRLTLRVAFHNRTTAWEAGDEIELGFDTDAKRTTGSPTVGTEVLLRARAPEAGRSTTWGVFRWNGSQFVNDPALTMTLVTAMNADPLLGIARELPGVLTIGFGRTLLGIRGAFNLTAATTAPDGSHDYAPTPGLQPFAYVMDAGPPKVRARASIGRRGTPIRIRYTVTDDSGRSQEAVIVSRNGKVVKTLRGRMGEARAGRGYFLTWRTTRKTPKGRYRFCVASQDPVGNVGGPSCATLRVS